MLRLQWAGGQIMGSTSSASRPTAHIDPRGPVFISYRQSDGREIAETLAWALRAAGVPVWHDQTDLPPGDTERRPARFNGSINSAFRPSTSGLPWPTP
ncbi:MAG: toll/interleukin-1 receptor domain-containing protein [Acidimicrobiia bacterium]|nr:toll/interleukin-1 receptor domain-containing protein [Acidimicrobiia bacterium]